MIRVFLLIGLLISVFIINTNLLENYTDDGYDNTKFLYCSNSEKLYHTISGTDEVVDGYGLGNEYFKDVSDIRYTGGDGDFSTMIDVYDARTNPDAFKTPICMQKTKFYNTLHIPSFFKQIYQGGDSEEILNVENSFVDIMHDPFYKHRNAREIQTKLILNDETNKMILNQHKTRKRESPHNNHIDIEDFHKTCEKHDPSGIPFDCGSLRKFNYKNASKQCEDNSLSENSCDKICCKPIQESFNMR